MVGRASVQQEAKPDDNYIIMSSALWRCLYLHNSKYTTTWQYMYVCVICVSVSVCVCVCWILWPSRPYGNSNNNRAVNEPLYYQRLSSWSAILWCARVYSSLRVNEKNVCPTDAWKCIVIVVDAAPFGCTTAKTVSDVRITIKLQNFSSLCQRKWRHGASDTRLRFIRSNHGYVHLQ